MGEREIRVAREHREGRAIGAQGAQVGMALHHPVEQAGGGVEISGLDKLQRRTCRLGDGGHGEEFRGLVRVDRRNGQGTGQGGGVFRPCGGPGDERREQERSAEYLSHTGALSFVHAGRDLSIAGIEEG